MSSPTTGSKVYDEEPKNADGSAAGTLGATSAGARSNANGARQSSGPRSGASMSEDVQLLAEVAARSEPALRRIYAKYRRLVYSLALRILRDEGEAEELVQEVFLHVWQKASLFDPERGAFESWLTTLAHHRAVDVLRTRRFRQRAVETRLDPADLAEIKSESTISDRSGLSESIELDERAKVYEAFAEIPPEQKQVLELAYYEGYSQSEIAEKLSLPLGTVKTRMRQGMIRLSKHLKGLRYEQARD